MSNIVFSTSKGFSQKDGTVRPIMTIYTNRIEFYGELLDFNKPMLSSKYHTLLFRNIKEVKLIRDPSLLGKLLPFFATPDYKLYISTYDGQKYRMDSCYQDEEVKEAYNILMDSL